MDELKQMSKVFSEEYLSQRLSDWFKKDVEYTHYETSEGTGKGDSYLSDVFRLTFHGKVKAPKPDENPDVSINVILKCFPRNIGRRKTFRSDTFFSNEINFYEQILPALLKFQSEKNVKKPFNNCPKVFASYTNGKDDFLAMEDLSIHNFGSAVRQEGIDLSHMKKTLETFAKFHALSFAFKDQHPNEYEKLAALVPETYYSPKYWDWYKGFWKLLCAVTIDAVQKELPNTMYEKKAKDFATENTYFRSAEAVCKPRKSSVIGHGDSWTPNFLYKYEGSVPVDAMMIDFQLGRSASPVMDIAFFIYACSTKDLRDAHYQDMLKYYYDVLSQQISQMGSDPEKVYSWKDFMDEIKELSFFGVAFSMESTPVTILEPDEAFDMDSITGEDIVNIESIWNIKPIKSQSGRMRLCGIIMHAVDNGYI